MHILVEVVGQEVEQRPVFFRQLVYKSMNRSHPILLVIIFWQTGAEQVRGCVSIEHYSNKHKLHLK